MTRRGPAPARAVRTDLVDAAALEVLGLVREQGWLADRALDRVLRRERRLYAGERRAVAEGVYGALRALGRLSWLLGPGRREPPPAAIYAAFLSAEAGVAPDVAGRRLGVPPGAVAAAVDGAAERIAAIADPVERLAVDASLPRWIAARFVAELGLGEATALARALSVRAPLTIRANLLATTRDALRARLAGEGVAARPTPLSPWGLVVDGRANLFALAAFQEGLLEIQDEGSQLAALAVGARPGQRVADCCAGAGGKALALAAEMHGKGSLVALDSDPERLDEARRRARRAGAHNVRFRPIPADAEAEAALSDLVDRCERVLVDAPCSGLGTLRRKPDARWRLRPEDPARFAALQRELLLRFSRLVAPGGRLVYATCSIGREENEDVASWLLDRRSDLEPLPLALAYGEELARSLGATGPSVQLLPHRHGTDGFFVAAFTRRR